MPTNLVRSVEDVASGDDVDFTLDVVPQTSDFVSNVTATLNFKLNGATTNVPFAFADGSLTNVLYAETAAKGLAALPNRLCISNDYLKAVMGDLTGIAGGRPFLTGDVVEYYATVNYYSDNADTNELARYEDRYFPDNHKTVMVGDVEHWVVEGTGDQPYTYVATNFTVTGDALSVVGSPVVNADNSVEFLVHAFTNANNIAKIVVTIDGKGFYCLYGEAAGEAATNRVTRLFDSVDYDGLKFDGNTTYNFTVVAKDAAGNDLPGMKVEGGSFTTLPSVEKIEIKGVYDADGKPTTAVELSVTGQAEGYEVLPTAWAYQGGTTWKLDEGKPNSNYWATVTATNAAGTSLPMTTNGYTLAAVATKAPVVEMVKATVVAGAENYVAADDGNPAGTEYALRVTTSSGGDTVVTNEEGEIWQTLDWWTNKVNAVTNATPVLDLLATNTFSFLSRNKDGLVSTNAAPVTTNCLFETTAGFTGNKAEQKADPFGTVAFGLDFADPVTTNPASVTVSYELDGVWAEPPLYSFDISLAGNSAHTDLTWNAWVDVKEQPGKYPYKLRVKMVSGARVADSTVSGELDFQPPVIEDFAGSPACGAVTNTPNYEFEMTIDEPDGARYVWSIDKSCVTNTEALFCGEVAAGFATHTLSAFAIDRFGNVSLPTNWSWTVNTVKPANLKYDDAKSTPLSTDAALTPTNETGFAFYALAEKPAGPSGVDLKYAYHWFLNGVEMTKVTGSAFTSDAAEIAGVEGTNTVVFWVSDVAGNRSDAAVTNSWIVDLHSPSNLVIRSEQGDDVAKTLGDGFQTKEKTFAFYATADDLTPVTYDWSLTRGGEPVTNATLAAGELFSGKDLADGTYTVAVSARDAAKNDPVSTNWTWTVDTKPPVITEFEGEPANGSLTNDTSYSFEVTAEDTTTDLRYVWTLDGVCETNTLATKTGSVSEGFASHKLTVSVFDELGNESAPTNWTWTVNTVEPTDLKFGEGSTPVSEDLAQPVVTNKPGFAFYATATAPTGPKVELGYEYHWYRNGSEVFTGADYEAEGVEGTNTLYFLVRDAAGNWSATAKTNLWVIDTFAPTNIVITGSPESNKTTTATAFDLTATALDSTARTYHWLLDDDADWKVLPEGEHFTGKELADGEHVVRVYVTDEAGNVSVTNTYAWTIDTTAPEITEFVGEPPCGSVVNTTNYTFTVTTDDKKDTLRYVWTLDSVCETNTSATKTGFVAKGFASHELTVTVLDSMNNESAPTNWSWTVNTVKPANLKYDAAKSTPLSTDAALTPTNETGFAFYALAEKPAGPSGVDLKYAYHWFLNGVEVTKVTGSAFTSDATEIAGVEGTNTVVFWVSDVAGNASDAAVTNRWIVDLHSPSNLVIRSEQGDDVAKTRGDGFQTKEKTFAFYATADDLTEVTYDWSLGGPAVTNATLAAGELFSGKDLEDGTYTVTVSARDAAGNAPTVTNWTWTVDNTVPVIGDLSGVPANGSITNETSYEFTVTAEDTTTDLRYVWTLEKSEDGQLTDRSCVTNDSSTYSGSVKPGFAAYALTVSVLDAAGNESVPTNWSWTVNTVKPTADGFAKDSTPVSTDPSDLVRTNETGFAFGGLSTHNVDIRRYHWYLNGTEVDGATAARFASGGAIQAVEGTNTVWFWVEDVAGNLGETAVTNSWIVDLHSPSNLVIRSQSGEDVAKTLGDRHVTNDGSFAFYAMADDLTAITYDWSLGGPTVTNATLAAGELFSGKDLEDGTYAVEVSARDAAGNAPTVTNWSWTVDATVPEITKIDGTPQDGCETNEAHYALSASSSDVNAGTNFWTLTLAPEGNVVCSLSVPATNGVAVAFAGDVAKEGRYTANFWSVDLAGNSSITNSWSWTYDTTPPGDPQFDPGCAPANGSVTSVSNYNLTVSSTDANVYNWTLTLNGASVREATGSNFKGDVEAEGVYTALVYTVDKAGNVSTTNSWTWIFDKTPPDVGGIKGVTPEYDCVTNSPAYELSASSDDANPGTNFWALVKDGATVAEFALPATNNVATVFKGEVNAGDGDYTAKFWSVDAAGNASTATNAWVWAYDAMKPSMPAFDPAKCIPADGAVTNGTPTKMSYSLTAESDEKSGLIYYWALLKSDGTFQRIFRPNSGAYTGMVSVEGVYTAMVYSVDAAGNISATNSWCMIYDRTPPTITAIMGTPENSCETNIAEYVLSASSDDLHPGTNFWALVKDGATVAEFALPATNNVATVFKGEVNAGDGDYTAKFWSVDAAGNASTKTNSWVWTVDTEKPVLDDDFGGTPVNGAVTNDANYALTMGSTKEVTYHWALVTNNMQFVEAWTAGGATFEGAVEADGVYTAMVYTVDRAGNHSATNTMAWTYDITPPKVTLTTASDIIDPEARSFQISIVFNEEVMNFTDQQITVLNGEVQEFKEKVAGFEYVATVGNMKQGPVSVSIAAGAVTDRAGNGNVASEVLSCLFMYRDDPLLKIVLTGKPANNSTTTVETVELTASEIPGVERYYWCVNGVWQSETGRTYSGVSRKGDNSVIVYGVYLDQGDWVVAAKSDSWAWTYQTEKPKPLPVDFGGGVRLPVSDEGVTNEVKIVAVSFQPGADSTVTMTGFEADSEEITNLALWLVVSESVTGEKSHAAVSGTATFDSAAEPKTLTVTLPASATTDKDTFFIFGVDNKE